MSTLNPNDPINAPTEVTIHPHDSTNVSIEATPIHDAIATNTPSKYAPEIKFVEKAAKAIWAFALTFITAAVVCIIPILLTGRVPSTPELITALGLGLAGAYGTGQTVYSVTNKG